MKLIGKLICKVLGHKSKTVYGERRKSYAFGWMQCTRCGFKSDQFVFVAHSDSEKEWPHVEHGIRIDCGEGFKYGIRIGNAEHK